MLRVIVRTNLPAWRSLLRHGFSVLTCVFTCIRAQAHPGHEGGHEGDEFIWTADHLTRHPAASLFIGAVGILLIWGAYRLYGATQRQFKPVVNRTPAADKTV